MTQNGPHWVFLKRIAHPCSVWVSVNALLALFDEAQTETLLEQLAFHGAQLGWL